jgi:chromosome segregation ATPase
MTSPTPEDAARDRQLQQCRRQLEEARARQKLLQLRVEELAAREQQLAKQVRRYRFLYQQQEKLVETLRGTVEERDRYQQVNRVLLDRIERLERRLTEAGLKLPARTQPATRPAAAPEPVAKSPSDG